MVRDNIITSICCHLKSDTRTPDVSEIHPRNSHNVCIVRELISCHITEKNLCNSRESRSCSELRPLTTLFISQIKCCFCRGSFIYIVLNALWADVGKCQTISIRTNDRIHFSRPYIHYPPPPKVLTSSLFSPFSLFLT